MDFYRIGTRKSILQGKTENIQGKGITLACESVYGEIFVPHCETMRLPSKCKFRGKTMRLERSVKDKNL